MVVVRRSRRARSRLTVYQAASSPDRAVSLRSRSSPYLRSKPACRVPRGRVLPRSLSTAACSSRRAATTEPPSFMRCGRCTTRRWRSRTTSSDVQRRKAKVAAYRDAAKRLRRGDTDVRFPEGCFPSRLPFVATRAPTCRDSRFAPCRLPPLPQYPLSVCNPIFSPKVIDSHSATLFDFVARRDALVPSDVFAQFDGFVRSSQTKTWNLLRTCTPGG